MRPKFQADADLHFDIVVGVLRREPAIDFQSAQEVFREGTEDRDVLTLAASEDRILVSHDVNSMPAAFEGFMAWRSSPGLFLIAQSVPIARAIEELMLIWSASEGYEWRDRVTWLPL